MNILSGGLSLIVVSVVMLVALPVLAIDLQSARTEGLVGELPTGYVKALGGGAEISALVSEINDKRKQEYERISRENGQPVDIVAKLAAEQIIAKLPSGAKYQDTSGNWQKR
ncbi:MAG: YdbL family protein [Hyphomicrobiales bacterium]|nr:YdbL family protein [Hyphomicrobiales bacterium]